MICWHTAILPVQEFIKKNKAFGFQDVTHYIIDKFHRSSHTCRKTILTKAEDRRARDTRTNTAEIFNAWIRPLIFSEQPATPQY